MPKKKMSKDNPEREQVSFIARTPPKRKQVDHRLNDTEIAVLRAMQDSAGDAGKYERVPKIAYNSGISYNYTASTLSVLKEGNLVHRIKSPGGAILYKITNKGFDALVKAGG